MGEAERNTTEDLRWIRQILLTFRWYLVSSVGFGAFEGARPADHSILDLIPPAIVFVADGGTDGSEWGKKEGYWYWVERFILSVKI